ncbi:MAG: PAS domain-containing protein [Cellulomonadaceae bacterium]|nr:PAS domain-containing protein [Cellulomonadaceae bacterium]
MKSAGRRGEAGLRHRQLATMLDQSPVATVVLDANGLVTEWNPAAETLLHRSHPDGVGRGVRDILPGALHEEFDVAWTAFADGRRAPDLTAVLTDTAGRSRELGAHVAPLRMAEIVPFLVKMPILFVLLIESGHLSQGGIFW